LLFVLSRAVSKKEQLWVPGLKNEKYNKWNK
jgi:hypothetical protein